MSKDKTPFNDIWIPKIKSSAHREQLKKELNDELWKLKIMKDLNSQNSFPGRISIRKIILGFFISSTLLAVGWSAEKLYQRVKSVSVRLERDEVAEFTFRGRPMYTNLGTGMVLSSESISPEKRKKIQRNFEAMKRLIAQGEYELVESKRDDRGHTRYTYRFDTGDEKPYIHSFGVPLDDVSSWEDINQKEKETIKEYYAMLNRAYDEGRFRLVDVEAHLVHECLDPRTGDKYRIQRITGYAGTKKEFYDNAYITKGLDPKDFEKSEPKMIPWHEHLQMIREGKLKLLNANTSLGFDYEVTLDDGSKITFGYAGKKRIEDWDEEVKK